MLFKTDFYPLRSCAPSLILFVTLVGIVFFNLGCTQVRQQSPSDLEDVAYLTVSGPVAPPSKLCIICPRFRAKLFAVDQQRVLDRNSVILEPGLHEVEFLISWQNFSFGIRLLRFEAEGGKAYKLVVRDISKNPYGALDETHPGYWIEEQETGKILAKGEGAEGEKGGIDRKWYIDQYLGRIEGIPSNDGEATVVVGTAEPLWITIAGSVVHAPPGSKGGRYTVPAGNVVIEVDNYRKIITYTGRLVVTLQPGKTYSIEAEGKRFSNTDISEVWITDAATQEKVGRFHSCWATQRVGSFSACEETWTAEIKYADIQPGDPRFWWGSSGRDF